MSENTPQGFEMTLGDGSVVKGANMEEAFQSLAKMKENASAEILRLRQEAEQANARLSALEQVRNTPEPKPVAPGQFDKNEYYRLLNDNPLDAQNYLDAFRFGIGDPQAVPQHFQRLDRTVTDLNQQAVAGAFLAQHAEDFPQDGTAASALTRRMEQLVMREGYPMSIKTMNMAYQELISEGAIKPMAKETKDDTPPPPPSLSGAGGSTADADMMAKAESMTDAELEKFLRQQGALR